MSVPNDLRYLASKIFIHMLYIRLHKTNGRFLMYCVGVWCANTVYSIFFNIILHNNIMLVIQISYFSLKCIKVKHKTVPYFNDII